MCFKYKLNILKCYDVDQYDYVDYSNRYRFICHYDYAMNHLEIIGHGGSHSYITFNRVSIDLNYSERFIEFLRGIKSSKEYYRLSIDDNLLFEFKNNMLHLIYDDHMHHILCDDVYWVQLRLNQIPILIFMLKDAQFIYDNT